jgi:hypothetical protein
MLRPISVKCQLDKGRRTFALVRYACGNCDEASDQVDRADGVVEDGEHPHRLIVTLTAALLVLFWAPSVFRRWALSVDLRALVFIHVSRFIGIDFLVLYRGGELPYDFAVPGELREISPTPAPPSPSLSRPDTRVGRGAVLAWNIFGFLDILFVAATATRLGLADPYSMRALLQLACCRPSWHR